MAYNMQKYRLYQKRGDSMCQECRCHPCHPRCPNAPEPRVVTTCEMCGEDILEGDTIYVIGDDTFCEECIRDSEKEAEID